MEDPLTVNLRTEFEERASRRQQRQQQRAHGVPGASMCMVLPRLVIQNLPLMISHLLTHDIHTLCVPLYLNLYTHSCMKCQSMKSQVYMSLMSSLFANIYMYKMYNLVHHIGVLLGLFSDNHQITSVINILFKHNRNTHYKLI